MLKYLTAQDWIVPLELHRYLYFSHLWLVPQVEVITSQDKPVQLGAGHVSGYRNQTEEQEWHMQQFPAHLLLEPDSLLGISTGPWAPLLSEIAFCTKCLQLCQQCFDCLTSTMALRAVSAPILRSVPGTLLLMVAGSIHIGMQNSS